MHVRRAALTAVLALSAAACGASGTATQAPGTGSTALPTIAGGGGGATQASVATQAGGGGGNVGVPTVADGVYTKGKAHVEITGDKTVTLDMNGSGFAGSGSGAFSYVDTANSISVSVVLAQGDSGLAIAGADIVTGGAWGKECQLNVTRNDAGGVAGEFSCPNVDAANPAVLKELKVSIKGTFSAER